MKDIIAMIENKPIIENKPNKKPKFNITKETYLDKYYSKDFLKLYFS